MTLTLTIITVNLNDQEGLCHTLRSVQEQTWPHIEHIVIDGGSTDGSLQQLGHWALGPNRRFVSAIDDGIADAMNKGVSLSSGELLMHLNAGDALVSRDVVARVIASQMQEQWLWGVGNLIYLDTTLRYRKRILRFSDKELQRRCYLPQPATFFSSSIREHLTFDKSYRISMDYDLFYRLAFVHGIRPSMLNFDITYFDTSGISQNFWRAYMENVRVRCTYRKSFRQITHEFLLFIETVFRRLTRRALVSTLGAGVKNRFRRLNSGDAWRIESVRS